MKFSVLFEGQLANPTPKRERQLFADLLAQAVYAEDVGFDGLWAVEHHGLSSYAHLSAPEVFLSAVAARTERIRIGHGVVCMPFGFNFPTRVAERLATLDILSNGRLNVGAGRGPTAQEQALLGMSIEATQSKEEVHEALSFLGHAWQNETFEWHGQRLDIQAPDGNPPLRIVPRPVQMPHPPLFLACTHVDTIRLAAEYGVGVLAFGFAGPENVANQVRVYREACAERTGSMLVSTEINEHFAALAPTIVLDDGDRARELGARGQRFFGESIWHYIAPGNKPPALDTENEDNVAYNKAMRVEMEARYDRGELPDYVSDRSLASAQFNVDHAYGDASTAIEHVQKIIDTGCDEIICLTQMGTIPQEACLETLRQWGEHILPHFRDQAAAGRRPSVTAEA